MPRPVHFEIHASDPQQLIDFYSAVFGWRFERWGEVPYWVIMTGDEDMGINGGLAQREGPAPSPDAPINGSVFVVGVADCQQSFDAALQAGGTQALPVTDMPGVGIMAYVKDPDGNVFGIIAPTMAPPD
jgi:predicted enzyme related to lactoylglutathione lyase